MHRSRISTCARRGLAASAAAGVLLTPLAAAAPASASVAPARAANTQAGPAPATKAASAAVGGSKVVCTSQKPGLAPELSHDIAGALKGRKGTAALAVYDRKTRTSCEFRAGAHFDSASVVKVTVLGALLREAQEAHRKLTSREVKLTTAMITKSDNDATSALWSQLGVPRVKHFLALANMRHTVPGAGGAWGLTRITAADELTLMRLLTAKSAVLDAASRGYAQNLMAHVEADQKWGVPAGAPASATAHVKNGWLSRATDAWRVHSVGFITGHGHDYGMTVLSSGNHTMAYGAATIEGATRVVNRDLNSAVRAASH
ncbi:serine hydrolase [Streptomyces sp. NBC_00859]|uniref:serine hydrolase n=1 Tax=Streptomyces sp. NBC_00859 TaxID=2903682 RepID=UPI00386825E3|nr:class A beta-lactamase-related serine hydrolase [Streptomyces sp. NBC_00859]